LIAPTASVCPSGLQAPAEFRNVELDRKAIALGEERDFPSVGTDARADVEPAAAVRPRHDAPGLARDGRPVREHAFGGLRDGGVPVGGQGVRVGAELPSQSIEVRPWIGGRSEERGHRAVAVLCADESPEGVAPAVGKVAGVIEIADVRQLLPHRRVAHPHRGLRVHAAERQVLRHSLGEPQRELQDVRRGGHRLAGIGAGEIELERVYELVTEHVIGLGEGAGHRQHDAALQGFRDAARPFAD
jgi:hypothetical protein